MPMPTPAQTQQTPPTPPIVPPPGAGFGSQAPNAITPPIEVLQAQAQAIGAQLGALREQQRAILRGLRTGDAQARAVSMGQLNQVNAQIAQLTTPLAGVQAQLAIREGATVVRTYPPTLPRRPGMDPDLVAGMWFAFIFAVLMPISIGIARRIWRGRPAPAPVRNDDSTQRLERLEQAIDTIAVEIERISESQRFMTKIMADRPGAAAATSPAATPVVDSQPIRALGAGPMEPVRVAEREAVKQ